jgi:catechol 2,3-dioxygenase-like lactoylglutathione lyase family enzyme
LSFAVHGIDHVEVFVRDIPASINWYGEVLGLKEICRWDPEPVMIGSGDTKLALFRAEASAIQTVLVNSGDTLRWHRVAWGTDAAGFEAAQAHLKQLGIPFQGPMDHRLAQSVYFNDPDGHLLEITYYR